jgi:hypothetical protein
MNRVGKIQLSELGKTRLPLTYRDDDHKSRWRRLDEAQIYGILSWALKGGR